MRHRPDFALHRSAAIARKELRELLRDPVYLGLAFVVPMLLLILFGYGLSSDVRRLRVAFVDHDRSSVSRDYIDRFVHSDYFHLALVTNDADAAEDLLRQGKVRVVIDIPGHFTRALAAGEPVTLGLTIDGSFPSWADVVQGYVTAINTAVNQELLTRAAARAGYGLTSLPVGLNVSVWYNPALESRNFIVPGMVVLILMLFPALLGSLLIVRERESGTIFNFLSSPVGRWEILAGKATPYIAVAFIDYVLLFAMARWLFDVRFVGQFWLLSLAALLYSTCTIGIGLLISVVSRSQLAAMLITFLVTITPAFNYSGLLAPVASQDAVGQFMALLIPATYFMDIVRGSFLKGLGFADFTGHLLALVGYTALLYGLSWALLRKRIG